MDFIPGDTMPKNTARDLYKKENQSHGVQFTASRLLNSHTSRTYGNKMTSPFFL